MNFDFSSLFSGGGFMEMISGFFSSIFGGGRSESRHNYSNDDNGVEWRVMDRGQNSSDTEWRQMDRGQGSQQNDNTTDVTDLGSLLGGGDLFSGMDLKFDGNFSQSGGPNILSGLLSKFGNFLG